MEGKLHPPNVEHPADKDYTPVVVGKPLCVEMIHLAFGNVEDWWRGNEILASKLVQDRWHRHGRRPPGKTNADQECHVWSFF